MTTEQTTHQNAAQQAVDMFWETVPPVWHLVHSQVHLGAAEIHNLTVEQFHVLRRIRRGRRSVSELAQARKISRPAVSRSVDVLVNKKYIVRTQDAEDRRRVILTLTPEGKRW